MLRGSIAVLYWERFWSWRLPITQRRSPRKHLLQGLKMQEVVHSIHISHCNVYVILINHASVFFATDLQGLKQKMQVEALQDKVLSGFAYMLSQNHRCKPNLLPQVLMCMPTLRTISTSYLELTTVPRHPMAPPPPDSTAMSMGLF